MLDRKGTDDELSVSTFADDVIFAGQQLIDYKTNETTKTLRAWGFDPDSGMYPGGVLPAELQNSCCRTITFYPGHLSGMSEEEWIARYQPAGRSETCQCNHRHVQWSQPDMEEMVCRPQRRSSRIPADASSAEELCSDYIRWVNSQASAPERGILHPCTIEADPSEVLYIMIDAVLVNEQEETRVKGGKPFQRSETTWIKHWNIRIETEDSTYAISSLDEAEAYKELLAVILKNHLYQRYFIFFIDGERSIFEAIKKYFSCWKYEICLDWYHVQEKVHTLLSLGIQGRRVPDPRAESKVVRQGKNKGTDRRKKTSLSQLYARALIRILWYGNVQEAMDYLQNINPEDIKSQKYIDDLLAYLCNKGQYIANSGVRKKAGLRNSSNGVEGQNMVVVADRQKENLMSWRHKGSGALAALSTLFANGEEESWFYEGRIDFALHSISGSAS